MEVIDNDIKLDFSDVLIVPKTSTLSSRSEVSVKRTFILKHAGWEWTGVPIIAANMDTTGTLEMARTLKQLSALTALHKFYDNSELNQFFVENDAHEYAFYSIGISEKDVSKLWEYAKQYGSVKMICVDVANGYTMQFLDVVSKIREGFPDSMIMAGNVVTPEKTEQVILAGADCVKVGIGPGSACTTRKVTGVGYPQLSAIIECAAAAHGVGGLVCGDGGCVYPGDVAKAFGAGADFVMLGGMLAGTDETSGDVVIRGGDPYKAFYGMSSKKANDTYAGGLNGYRAAEGKEMLVPYKGPVSDVMQEILGGVRSAMTYVGAVKLKELTKRTKFVRVNNQINNVFSRYEV